MTPIFDNPFVLELGNNHWGRLKRGLKIVNQFGHVTHAKGVREAIKHQFDGAPSPIHRRPFDRGDDRNTRKVCVTELSWTAQKLMVQAVSKPGLTSMALGSMRYQ